MPAYNEDIHRELRLHRGLLSERRADRTQHDTNHTGD